LCLSLIVVADDNLAMRHFLLGMLAVLLSMAARAEEGAIALPSGESMAYSRYPAESSKDLLLWFASERGQGPAEIQAACDLAARGTEVWLFDMTAALFLPQTNSSMDQIHVQDMQAIFDRARKTGAGVTVYAVNRAAVPVLRGLAGERKGRTKVLLMHPHFYSRVDTLVGADYLSLGNLSSVDVLILQPRRSAATPWVGEQLAALREEGANAQLLMLENVRERYWVRESATDFEVAEGKRLAERITEWRKELK
jgi:hypothetical protein